MQPIIGSRVKDKHATSWLAAIARHLYPGEAVVALAHTASVRPLFDCLAVTNARVLAFRSHDLSNGFCLELAAADIVSVQTAKPRFSKVTLTVIRRDGQTVSLGVVPDPDMGMVLGAVRQLSETGPAVDVVEAIAHPAELEDAEPDKRQRTPDTRQRVEVLGVQPNRGTWKAIKDHCSPDETPWFVLGSLGAGALAAFEDRCMIVKAGVMPSLGAGSLGGGRITTFPYAEITAIEYNAGLVSGVLEVLTPSYSGSSNKDYWRGVGKDPNANTDNPRTLSNTLPVGRVEYQRALPRLNQMRARIAESKRPIVIAPPAPTSPPASTGIADELTKLAGLRDQGVLTNAEFDVAKKRLLGQHGSA